MASQPGSYNPCSLKLSGKQLRKIYWKKSEKVHVLEESSQFVQIGWQGELGVQFRSLWPGFFFFLFANSHKALLSEKVFWQTKSETNYFWDTQQDHCYFYAYAYDNIRPMQESKRSQILDSTTQIPDFRYWILDSLSVELGFGISIVSGIPDSTRKIYQISDSTSKNFPDYGVRISLHASNTSVPKNMSNFTQYTYCTNIGTVFVVHLIWREKKTVRLVDKRVPGT